MNSGIVDRTMATTTLFGTLGSRTAHGHYCVIVGVVSGNRKAKLRQVF